MTTFDRAPSKEGHLVLKVHDPYQPGSEAYYYKGDRVKVTLDSFTGAQVVEGDIKDIWAARVDVEVNGALVRCHYVDIYEINLI